MEKQSSELGAWDGGFSGCRMSCTGVPQRAHVSGVSYLEWNCLHRSKQKAVTYFVQSLELRSILCSIVVRQWGPPTRAAEAQHLQIPLHTSALECLRPMGARQDHPHLSNPYPAKRHLYFHRPCCRTSLRPSDLAKPVAPWRCYSFSFHSTDPVRFFQSTSRFDSPSGGQSLRVKEPLTRFAP